MNLTPEQVEKVMGKMIWQICPHCKTGQRVIKWKDNPCGYLKCMKLFDVEMTSDGILAEMYRMSLERTGPTKVWVQKKPILQKMHNCTVLVAQGGEWIDENTIHNKS